MSDAELRAEVDALREQLDTQRAEIAELKDLADKLETVLLAIHGGTSIMRRDYGE